MPFKPGQSGNPHGRPVKKRALTEILQKAGSKTIQIEGKKTKISRKRVVADMVWQLVSEGECTMPDGTVMKPSPKDWLDALKWLYRHIDGPPPQNVDMDAQGQVKVIIEHVRTKDTNTGKAPTTTGDIPEPEEI